MLAYFALAMSILGCCPLVSAVGGSLGLVALRRITQSNGTLRGRRVANASVIVSLIMTIGGVIGWSQFASSVQKWIKADSCVVVERFIQAADRNDAAASRSIWAHAVAATFSDQAIAAFAAEALRRYGRLREFRVTSIVPGPTTVPTTFEVAGTFVFQQAERTGSATVLLEPTNTFRPIYRMRLMSLTIDDKPLGDLALPPPRKLSATNATSVPASVPAPASRPSP